MNIIFSTTLKHLRRSPYQALTATIAMFLTFLLGSIFALASLASAVTLKYFESKPQITVFFNDKSGAAEASTLQKTLEATGKTISIKYVSQEEALAIYREQNKNDPLLLEMVTADILPASLEITAANPRNLTELEPLLKNVPGVEEVVYQKDVVDALISWTRAIRWTGATIAFLLALNSLLITLTVISMKIAMKKEELEILNLVGASPWFIRFPFIWEGIIYGLVGATLAWIIVTGLLLWLRPVLLGFLGVIPELQRILASSTGPEFISGILIFGGLLAAVGIFLGAFGSMLALARYLKL